MFPLFFKKKCYYIYETKHWKWTENKSGYMRVRNRKVGEEGR